MIHDPIFLPTLIEPGQSKRIVDGKGTVVRCIKGNIWITQAGDVRDIVLVPGQRFALDRNGLALLVALDQPAVAEVVLPAEVAAEATLAALRAGNGAYCPSPAARRQLNAVSA